MNINYSCLETIGEFSYLQTIGMIVLMFVLGAMLLYLLEFYIWYFLALIASFLLAFSVNQIIYFYVFSLGMLTAFAEIIGKFQDEPLKTLRSGYAVCYHILNGLIAAFALKLLILNDFKISNGMDQIKVVLTAGLGSMLVMRSKLFNITVKDQDIAVGPDQIMTVFLNFMKGSINRNRSILRMNFVKEKLKDIDVEKVCNYCIVMLDSSQDNKEDTISKIKKAIEELGLDPEYSKFSKQEKALKLGFILLERGESFVSNIFDNAPLNWKFRAPNDKGIFERTLECMVYGSDMCGSEMRKSLGWDDMEETFFKEKTTPRKCKLENHRLVFNKKPENDDSGKGHANIIEENNDFIEGVVYKLPEEVIKFLDINSVGYIRKEVSAIVENKPKNVQIYIAESPREGLKPDRAYFENILKCAKEQQLSNEYLAKLQAIETFNI